MHSNSGQGFMQGVKNIPKSTIASLEAMSLAKGT